MTMCKICTSVWLTKTAADSAATHAAKPASRCGNAATLGAALAAMLLRVARAAHQDHLEGSSGHDTAAIIGHRVAYHPGADGWRAGPSSGRGGQQCRRAGFATGGHAQPGGAA